MADIFVLALAAAIYPVLLAAVIVILVRPEPARQLLAFLVGGMAVSVTAGLLLLALAEGSGEFTRAGQAASPALDLALGGLSLGVACALATGRPRRLAAVGARRSPEVPSRTSRVLARASLPLTLALGVALNLPGVWYLAALKQIATGDYPTATDVALVLAFNVIMFALVEIPLVAYVISPQRARAAVDVFNVWLRDHRRPAAIAVAGAAGTYLVVRGLAEALG